MLDGLFSMRERRSSMITSRSVATSFSVSFRFTMRSASISITVVEPVLGDALVVAGHVVAGEGVVLAAEPGDDLGELAGRDLVRRLEHQVLEEMRDARDARRLVGRADAIPDVVRHDRRAVVGHDDDLHAVGELELAHAADDRARLQRLDGLREHCEGECEEEKEAAIA